MNKFFKYLGIGTAIGTLVYAVIKYKHDEKFKEKVDDVVDKAEEKADKALCKAGDFINKHPGLFTMSFLAITTIPCVIHAVNADKRRQEMMQKAYEEFRDYSDEECDRINDEARIAAQKRVLVDDFMDNPSDYLIVKKDCWDGMQKANEEYENQLKQKQIEVEISRKSTDIINNWKEDYRDKWNRVNEFAKMLDLVEGESFMIEEGSQYDCDGTIVSHLINGEGCYPPEMD